MKKVKGYRRIKLMKNIRIGVEGMAFILLLCNMVFLVSVYRRLNDRFPLNFDDSGRVSEWGMPIHFIIVFAAGMLVYGGLSVLSRFKHIFGFALFADEHKSRTKYEATLLMFTLLKLFSLAIFLAVMANMYVRARHTAGMPFLDWVILIVVGCIAVTVLVYFLAMKRLSRRKKRPKSAATPSDAA